MVSETRIAKLKKLEGRRVEMTGPMVDPNPIPVGEKGTITSVDDAGTLHVKWDSGRNLGLLEEDPYRVLRERHYLKKEDKK